jgi:protein dithiol oxidoreductase (disulfide-forming)
VKRFRRYLMTAAALLLVVACMPDLEQDPALESDPFLDPDAGNAVGSAIEPLSTEAVEPVPAAVAESGASQFQLNRHYRRLSPTQPTSSGPDQVEIAVLFSYGCIPCRTLEADLARNYPPAGRTARHRLVLIPSVAGDRGVLWARAWYTAVALGRADELHAAMYREVLDAGRALDSEDELRALFTRTGVTAQAFDELFHSTRITADVRRASDLARRYRVSSAPAVVVNGRYVTTVDMAGGREATVQLVTELFARESLRN